MKWVFHLVTTFNIDVVLNQLIFFVITESIRVGKTQGSFRKATPSGVAVAGRERQRAEDPRVAASVSLGEWRMRKG